jgi:hypothetical protein
LGEGLLLLNLLNVMLLLLGLLHPGDLLWLRMLLLMVELLLWLGLCWLNLRLVVLLFLQLVDKAFLSVLSSHLLIILLLFHLFLTLISLSISSSNFSLSTLHLKLLLSPQFLLVLPSHPHFLLLLSL